MTTPTPHLDFAILLLSSCTHIAWKGHDNAAIVCENVRAAELVQTHVEKHVRHAFKQREQDALNADLLAFGTAASLNGQHIPLDQVLKNPMVDLILEQDRLRSLLSDAYGILEEVAIADSGHPEQDAFEREVFENIKKELGR